MKRFIICVIMCCLIGFVNKGYAEELLAEPPIVMEQMEEEPALCEPPVCKAEVLAEPLIAVEQEEAASGLAEPPVAEMIEEQPADIKTNAERIREMSDAELAIFIETISNETWNRKDALEWLKKTE